MLYFKEVGFSMFSSLRWLFGLVILAVVSQSVVPPATGDMCFADNSRATIINDVLYFMGGSYSFVNGDTNANEKFLYYVNLTTSFPVEGYIPVNSLHSVAVPSAFQSANTGAFFAAGDMLYSYSSNSVSPAATDTIMAYNTVTNTWSNTSVSGGKLNLAGRGGGFTVTDAASGMGFYLGTGSPGDSNGQNIQGLLIFNGSDSKNLQWTNQTDNAPNVDTGTMNYIPLSKEGVLIAFGGVDTTATSDLFSDHCCYANRDMSIINVYDIASNTWYSVTATGSIPPSRELTCSVVSASPDGSSYQITMYQGWDLLEGQAYEDVYVLTIPSFRWIKISDTGNTEKSLGSTTGRFGGACAIWNDRQMIVVGGGFRIGSTQVNGGTSCNTSYPAIKVLDLNTYAWQTQFQSDLSAYEVPEPVYNLIGGNGSGGATTTVPAGGFNNTNLDTIFAITTKIPTSTSSSSTGTGTPSPTSPKNPTGTGSSNVPPAKSTPVGAIAGGVVGGVAALAILAGALWYFMRHRRRTQANLGPQIIEKPELGDGRGFYAPPKEVGVGQDFGRSELQGPETAYELHQDQAYELPGQDRRPD